ncbi:thiamine pyrophosphokinase, putative [Plasmodium reichenowi]|uniref:Thiamine pyrophosphokinase, putative n=1 Tax=Plasmodium reichenowi TaxID=5854 RepID=A0A151LHW2_PLARE|nr:thiamine pyrophosphokinase, putative [Plasmodium reichenowi]KYN98533.1 thiamine pyrophosphokinase, putative [Plasmodium reichenowi]
MKKKYTYIFKMISLKYFSYFNKGTKVSCGNKERMTKNHKHHYSSVKEKDDFLHYHNLDFMKYIFSNNNKDKAKDIKISTSVDNTNPNVCTDIYNYKLITIILNNTLCSHSYEIIKNSNILICADGGANRLYDLCSTMNEQHVSNYCINNNISFVQDMELNKSDYKKEEMKKREKQDISNPIIQHTNDKNVTSKKLYDLFNNNHKLTRNVDTKKRKQNRDYSVEILPDFICGDFDSIHPHVYKHYKNKGVLFEKCQNQENTDLDKCIEKIKPYIYENDKILVLGATGNRFDQTCANISSLYKNVQTINNIYLIGENNFIFLLKKGNHVIQINLNAFQKGCALLPIGGKCKVKTEGLKYNLNYEYLSFDSLISSSNEILQNEIKISNDTPLIWNSQLKNEEF